MRLARFGPVVVAAALLGAATSAPPAVIQGSNSAGFLAAPVLPAPRALVLSAQLAVVAGELSRAQQDLALVDRRVAQLRLTVAEVRKGLDRARVILERQLEAASPPASEATPAPSTSVTESSATETSAGATTAAPSPGPSPTVDPIDRTLKSRDRLSDAIRQLQVRVASLHGDVDSTGGDLDALHQAVGRQARVLTAELGDLRARRFHERDGGSEALVQFGAGRHLLALTTTLRHEVGRRRAELAALRSELGSQERGSADELADQAVADVVGPGSGVLLICPVDPPRTFSDDFGAPRWAGGFHTHQGNDIFAPLGTPIRAPFAGNAVASPNSLGGESVKVFGAQGYVYNAHLSAYGTLGQVETGTIIGYVGNSGDAMGGPTHDHFEWHPGGGAAVNPYPFLTQIC